MLSTIPDSHRDLLLGQVATLATVGRDGRPQLSEVWFLAEGDTVSISRDSSGGPVIVLLRPGGWPGGSADDELRGQQPRPGR